MASVAAVVSSSSIILVEGEYNADGTVTIIKDETLNIESGDRHKAYAIMATRIRDRLTSDVDTVLVKASSGGQFAAKTVVLHAAELRGVFLSAIPTHVEVVQKQIKTVSRGRSRKVDEYVKDDDYFDEKFGGVNLRKGSREAAFLILNEGDE
ncbi:hypothetical protein NKJ28_24415 [Mesorhizobium sp. M0145]|uniref:hypothetical protein n=1 Tax=Mesorhizobium sp. M0145 TaxID=2956895 RepID=UPI003337B6AA